MITAYSYILIHQRAIYRILSTLLFISFCQIFYGQIPDDYGFGGRFLAPKDFKYSDCVFCYGPEMPSDSDFYAEIFVVGLDNIRIVYSNKESFIYDYKIRIPFSSRLLSGYINNSIMSDKNPFVTGQKKADYRIVTDYPLRTIRVYRHNRVIKKMEFKSPYKGELEYIYSDAFYDFWKIVDNLCIINNVIQKQIGFESLYNNALANEIGDKNEGDSIIVKYSANRNDIDYTFKLMSQNSYMICDSLAQYSVNIGNYMKIIAQKELQKDGSAFVKSSCPLSDEIVENELENVECILFQVYRNGKLSKTERYYNTMFYDGKKVRYNETYNDYLRLVKAYVNLFQQHLKSQSSL